MTEMRPKALVVEDDAVTRSLLKTLLEEEGCRVDVAADGLQAVELLDQNPDYQVVLLDIVLPKLSGTGVMEHLQNTNPELLHRVIVVTGLQVSEVRMLFPTICHTLAKPVIPGRLLRWVQVCINPTATAPS